MYTTLLLATALISVVIGRPKPDVSPECKDVPTNPVAHMIGAQFLAIPGCSGTSGSSQVEEVPPVPSNTISTPSPSARPSSPPVTSSSPSTAGSTGSSGTGNGTGSTGGTGSSGSSGSSTGSSTGSSGSGSSSTGSGSSGGNASMSTSGDNLSRTFSASITRYGQGPDGTPGTDNSCQHNQGACGNNPISGYTAAANVFLFVNGASGTGGVDASGVPGKACGTCWRVTGTSDFAGKPMSITPVVVLITNECAAALPGQKKNLCGMTSFDDHDDNGNEVLIDLCMDSGASRGFWGPPPWGASDGSATQVDCSEWCGTFADGKKSGPPGCSAPGETWELQDKSGNPSTFY